MQSWTLGKSEIRSPHGLVAAQNRHAALAGAAVLAKGGNAMDAAVVTALVLSVVEPWLSGIGGGGFLLHARSDGAVEALDFNVVSPSGIEAADYPLVPGKDGDWFDWPSVQEDRNLIGPGSICVPGAIAGLAAALERFGTLSWEEALAPAIAAAEQGLEVDWFASLCLAIDAAGLARFEASAELFLDNGRAPRVPERGPPTRRPMPRKAAVLRRLARAGARDFYEGETAALLARDLAAVGSKLSAADLAAYQPHWREPAAQAYRDRDIRVIPGLSGGPSFLETLSELTGSLPEARNEAESAAAYATAIRNAYRRRLITLGHASAARDPGCTSHLSVVDAAGNMVALTNTLLSRFGSKVVMPEAGFLMNNGMMWFDPRPGQPNSIAPSAKPLANMCPVIVLKEGRPEIAIGAAGGRMIFPALIQLLSYVIDRGMSLEQAFQTPRLDASGPTIKVNRAAAPDVAARIARDFPVEIVEDTLYPVNFAVPSAVRRDPVAGLNHGMAHPTSPWSDVGIGG